MEKCSVKESVKSFLNSPLDLDQKQNLMGSTLPQSFVKISSGTNKQTGAGENITSLSEVIKLLPSQAKHLDINPVSGEYLNS